MFLANAPLRLLYICIATEINKLLLTFRPQYITI